MTRKIFLLFMAALFLAGCAGVTGKLSYPTAVTPEIQKEFNNAESLYMAKRYNEADLAYQRFIEGYGYNALTDDARFKRGEISYLKRDYEKALEFYRSAYANVYSPIITPKSRFRAACALYYLGRYSEAKAEASKVERRDASQLLLVKSDSLAILSSRAAGETEYAAIGSYLFLLDDYSQMSGRTESLREVPNIVTEDQALSIVRKWVKDNSVSSSDVERLPLKEYKGKTSGGYAFFKLGKSLNQEGDYKKASRELQKYVSTYPKHEYYAEARSLLGETAGKAGEVALKVGVVLPLSGKYTIYGESVLHGIECAAGVYEPCEKVSGVQLLVRDSMGLVENAVAAVEDLAANNAIAIIGPLLSVEVGPAAQRAQELGIPIITVSQREGTSAIGENIFRNTVTIGAQVDAIVDYAAGRKNMKRFVILYPRTRQGSEYKDLFTESVKRTGGRIVAAHSYSTKSVEFASDLRSMPLVSYGEDKKYDAIFIPDSFAVAGYIASSLAMMGVEGVNYLGISRWADPKLVELGGKYVEGAVFPEAFYKKSSDFKTQDFVSRFRQAYGIDPTLLEALGYDSLKMIIEAAANSGAAHRGTLRSALAKITDFHGVIGKTSFNERRDAVRELPLLRVSNGSIVPVAR
jgi:ABC-type branched-subunit amino acid transport system substrate-binding protein